ncbi:MAG: FAD-binding oxidoreductase [Polyangiales bacterium]
MDPLARDLAALLSPDAVSTDGADRSAYAHDLWPRQLIATRGDLPRPSGPRAVVWPRTDEQLSTLLRFAATSGVSLIPYGAGSGVVGAIQPGRDVVAVDMKRMRALTDVDVARGRCTAEAGYLGEHLEERLRRRGATLGHFPSSIYCSTVGGWVATRSAGQCSGRYGKIEDMVLGVEGVLGDGEPFRAAAPREGEPDMRPLLVGSEGTFGFLTRATLRVWPAPTQWKGLAFTFSAMRDAWGAIRALYQAGLRPAVTRLYDPFDTWLFLQGSTSHDAPGEPKPSPGRRDPRLEAVLRRVLDHPRAVNAVAHTLADHVYGRSLLIVVFEATDAEPVDDALARARSLCLGAAGRDAGDAAWRRWLVRRHAVSYRQPPTYTRGVWADTMEVAAPWSRLGALYENVREALGGGGFVMAHMSHAYPDGCSIYFTFAGASKTDADATVTYDATWKRALAAAHDAGGTVAHHHGVGRSKRSAMGMEWGAGVRVLEALRGAADPSGVLVRGALVPDASEALTRGPEAPEAIVVDAVSRHVSVRLDTPLATLREALARDALTLPDGDGDGTVGAWLASLSTTTTDPVDHRVAGWCGALPTGERMGWIASPRRSTGPDVLPLLARDGRFGALDGVVLRVRGDDERGPAWLAPCEAPEGPTDPHLAAWIERAAKAMRA